MWKAVFEVTHKSCIIAPRCKKFSVTDLVYLLSGWEDKGSFFYVEAHVLQGEEKNIKLFIKDLKKDSSIENIEVNGNFVITLNKRPGWMSAYSPLFDRRLIQVKPVIMKTDGTEWWEIACWDKEPLMYILTKLPEEFKVKLRSIEKTKIGEVFLPHIMPNLTDKQKLAIETAVKGGYYNFPRSINLKDIAKKMNLTKQTTQQHLRIAEKKIIPFLTENINREF